MGNRSVPIIVTRGSRTLPLGESKHKATIICKVQNSHNLRTTLEKGESCSNPQGRKIELGLLSSGAGTVKLEMLSCIPVNKLKKESPKNTIV